MVIGYYDFLMFFKFILFLFFIGRLIRFLGWENYEL